uniref:2Fe-2S ferredoxin-type domain-containing protein n=1 Tax=Octactis speculum TaxID=3111310 RepID=A0A7S2MMY2_9STRA
MTVMFPPGDKQDDKKIRLMPGRKIRQALLTNGVKMGSCAGDLQCLCSCAILIRRGKALLAPSKTQERVMLKKEPDWRLSCRAFVGEIEGDEEMVVRIRPDMENIMRKTSDRDW